MNAGGYMNQCQTVYNAYVNVYKLYFSMKANEVTCRTFNVQYR